MQKIKITNLLPILLLFIVLLSCSKAKDLDNPVPVSYTNNTINTEETVINCVCEDFDICAVCNGKGIVNVENIGLVTCPQCSGLTHKCKTCGKSQANPNPPCPSCNGTKVCAKCNGVGMTRYFDGSMQQCFSCSGNGVCSTCNLQELNKTNQQFYGGTDNSTVASNANNHSKSIRTKDQIQLEINNTQKILNEREKLKEHLTGIVTTNSNNYEITLLTQKLQELQQEYIYAP